MSSIPQTTDNGNSVSDFATKFMKRLLLFTANRSQIPIKNIFPLYVFYHVRHETDSFIYFL